MAGRVIRNPDAFRRLCEQEDRERLARLSVDETIAIGEALLTSELMSLSQFRDDDRPVSLHGPSGSHQP